MRVEPVEFLVDVDLLGQEGDLLLEAAGLERLGQFADACQQLLPQAFADFRQPAAHLGDVAGDGVEAVADHRVDLRALALARRAQAGRGFGQQLERRRVQRFRVGRLLLDHAVPAHQRHRVGVLRGAAGLGDVAVQFQQAAEQFPVEREVRAGRAGGGHETQGRIDLAAAQVLAEDAADFRFQCAELLRHAKADLEVTVVDRAEFPRHPTEVVKPLGAGEACHAANHRGYLS